MSKDFTGIEISHSLGYITIIHNIVACAIITPQVDLTQYVEQLWYTAGYNPMPQHGGCY